MFVKSKCHFFVKPIFLGFTLSFLLVSTHFAKLCKLALTSLDIKTAHETQSNDAPRRPFIDVLSVFFA
jgi:hypothetical protein